MVMVGMKDYFNRFCIYYLNHFNKSYYKKIIKEAKKNNVDYEKIDIAAKEYTSKLKEKLNEFNCRGLKKDTYEMINRYIKIKDDMDEEDKKVYLEILSSLCRIYGINLRDELKDYVTELMHPEDVFKELVKCYLEDKAKEEIDRVRVRCKLEYFADVEERASALAKDTKKMCKKFNYIINGKNSINEAISNYILNKDEYTNDDKSEILNVLALVSRIYDINLREEIEKSYKDNHKDNSLIKNASNPLDNKVLLIAYLFQKYHNCNFNIRYLVIPNYYNKNKCKEVDYTNIQAKLIKKIITIYLDKINNYGTQDINPLYINTLSIDDMTRIDDIEEDAIVSFIEYVNKGIEEDIVIRKLEMSDVLYHFLVFLVNSTDIYNANIGSADNNLFMINGDEDNIAIYIGTDGAEKSLEFLAKYIIKCIENNVSYNMINKWETTNHERTILLANKESLYLKMDILDEMGKEYEAIVNTFDKPIVSSACLENKYYGVSFYKIGDLEYNDFFDSVAEVAYYRVLGKLEVNKIHNEDNLKIINSFISLKSVEGSNPLEAIYDGNSFSSIKDIINRYITEISSSLDVYFSSEDKLQLFVDEFSKSMMYIANICRGKKKNSKSNIAISDNDVV